jgi:hypothetical protein
MGDARRNCDPDYLRTMDVEMRECVAYFNETIVRACEDVIRFLGKT